MAKIVEQQVVIKLSTIVKDTTDNVQPIVGADFVDSVEAVVQELVSGNVVVEVYQLD
jgi:hypothetical protein